MKKTRIDWCDSTWNPVTGCLHGCEYCYARKIANRFGGGYEFVADVQTDENGKEMLDAEGMPIFERLGAYPYEASGECHVLKEPACENDAHTTPHWREENYGEKPKKYPYPWYFDPTFHQYRLNEPRGWKKPRTIFVCSMADLFGDWVPDIWIKGVFDACEKAPQHRFLFLTKNPARFGQINGWNHRYNNEYAKENMWFGTTVTRQQDLNRIRNLPYGNAHTFLSIEPILERIDLDRYLPTADTKWHCSYCGHYANTYANHCDSCGRIGGYSGSFRKQPVNWIILGAESGNRKDRVAPRREWIDSIVRMCGGNGIPVFMKESLRELMGDDFRQEFPWEVER